MRHLRTLAGKVYRNLFAQLHLRKSLAELRHRLDHSSSNPDGWITITETFQGRGWFAGIPAWQVRSEFLSMVEAVLAAKPARILEIGTARGATLLCWCRIASSHVISVDLPGGIHGGGYHPLRQKLYQGFTHDRKHVRLDLFQENSQIMETRRKVETVLSGEKLDVLFIDGDHSYEGVKKDFDLWSPLVRPGGIILFHDILPHRDVADCEVDRLWAELRPLYAHQEIVDDAEQGWAGIGVLTLPSHP